ncbi:unnamed protein product [Ixodes persulcatus]
MSSVSKTSVDLGGILSPANGPVFLPSSGGTVSFRCSPTHMSSKPSSQPLTT